MATDFDTLEAQIERKTLTGDYYPAFAKMLLNYRARGSGESVNLAGAIGKTKGDWFGIRLNMMFPSEVDAQVFFEPLLALLADMGLNSATLLRAQWEAAKRTSDAEARAVEEFWFDDCGQLTRKGVRSATVR